MSMLLFVTLAELPALSVTLFVTLWSAPSPKTTSSGQAPESPERASPHVKWTVTSELFQPLALGAGLTEAEIVGSVRSILAETERVVELPATSETVLDTTVWLLALADSAEAVRVKLASLIASARPDTPSEAVKAWDRSVLRQVLFTTPAGSTVGALVSTLNSLEDSVTLSQVALVALAYTTVVPWPSVGAVEL